MCEDEAKSAWGAEVQQGNLLWGWEEKAASRSPERGEGSHVWFWPGPEDPTTGPTNIETMEIEVRHLKNVAWKAIQYSAVE